MTERDPQEPGFGPFESLRALTDLQMQGIRAASQVAERFTRLLDGDFPNPWAPTAAAGNGEAPVDGAVVGEVRANMARLADLYADIFQRMFDSYADLLERQARRGPQLDAGATIAVQLNGAPGDQITGDIWLHDYREELGPVTLRPTSLTHADGTSIPSSAISVSPSVITEPDPTGTSRIRMAVATDANASLGKYHGFVLAEELPDEALQVVVELAAVEPEPAPEP